MTDQDIFLEEMAKFGKKDKLKITFVCSGNICRSAYADFAFREMIEESPILKDKIIVDSGGLAFRNESIDSRTVRFLLEDGSKFSKEEIESHKPRYKNDYPEMFDETDIIVGMTRSHKMMTPKRWRKGPEAKFRMLRELASNESIDIGDPYWTDDYGEYKQILLDVKKNLEILKEKLEKYFSR